MSKWNKKHAFSIILHVFIFIVIFIVAIPLIINWLFKLHAPYEFLVAEWKAGDALSFYATIIASLLAIYGISLTIKASTRDFHEEIRNQMLPFVIVDFLETNTKSIDPFAFEITEELPDPEPESYNEYSLSEINFIISENSITPKRYLSGHQRTIIENRGFRNIPTGNGGIATVSDMYIYLPMSLENVGKGAAIRTRIGLNKIDSPKEQRVYVTPFPLKVGQSLKVAIFSEIENRDSSVIGKYELEIFYQDIYGNQYRQAHNIQIYFKNKVTNPCLSIDTLQEQELLSSDSTPSNATLGDRRA